MASSLSFLNTMSESDILMEEAAEQRGCQELLPQTSAAEEPQQKQLALCRQPAAAGKGSGALPKPMGSAGALRRYQHYTATLGKELALLLLCQGTSALAAAVRVSYRYVEMLVTTSCSSWAEQRHQACTLTGQARMQHPGMPCKQTALAKRQPIASTHAKCCCCCCKQTHSISYLLLMPLRLLPPLQNYHRLVRLLSLQLHHWLTHSPLPKAAVAVLTRALRSLRSLLQQHVLGPLGRLLTQLVWVQVQLSSDDVLEEGTRLSARINSCVSLLFGSIRCEKQRETHGLGMSL